MNGDVDRGTGAGNLTLADLVDDPLVGLVMRSDGVDRAGIEALFERIAQARPKIGICRRNLAAMRRQLSANRPR
jgi:hypothetical protein